MQTSFEPCDRRLGDSHSTGHHILGKAGGFSGRDQGMKNVAGLPFCVPQDRLIGPTTCGRTVVDVEPHSPFPAPDHLRMGFSLQVGSIHACHQKAVITNTASTVRLGSKASNCSWGFQMILILRPDGVRPRVMKESPPRGTVMPRCQANSTSSVESPCRAILSRFHSIQRNRIRSIRRRPMIIPYSLCRSSLGSTRCAREGSEAAGQFRGVE